MGKLKVVVIGVVAVAAVALIGLFWLQSSIRRVVERAGSQAMGVETTVQSADLDLFGGRLDLSQLRVANPDGFPSPHFLEIGGVQTQFQPTSFLSSTIRIPLVVIDNVSVNLDSERGNFNYRKILENLRNGASQDGDGGSGGKKLVISRLQIRNITAKLTLGVGAGAALAPEPITIPEVVLKDLDSDGQNSLALRQLVRTIVETVMRGVAEKGKGQVTKELLSGLWGNLTGQSAEPGRKAKPEIEGVVNDLQRLLKQP